MKHTSPARTAELPRFPIVMLSLTLLLTIATLAWLFFNTYFTASILNETVTKGIRGYKIRGEILLYDERLTMAAHMGIATKDQKWENRYNKYDALLSDAINEALLLIPPSELDQTAKKADTVNAQLVALERHAFNLSKEGKTEEAQKILFSPEYENLKNQFDVSMQSYEKILQDHALNNLQTEIKHAKFSFFILILDFFALVIVWTITYKNLSFWKKELEHKIQSEVEYKKEIESARHFLNEVLIINKMNDRLQTCQESTEAYVIVAHTAQELFSGLSGGLCIRQEANDDMQTVEQWGDFHCLKTNFNIEDCWALREGHIYIVNELKKGIVCQHFEPKPTNGYLCLPLIVQSGTIGILELSAPPDGVITDHQQQLAITFGEVLRLSLGNIMLRETLSEQATRDPLTGLFNRRTLDKTLNRLLHRAIRNKDKLTVAMVDIDHFKQINDTYGHDAGDEVLKHLGAMLMKNLRENDLACRYGGEEFIIVMEAGIDDTLARLQEICAEIKTIRIHSQGEKLPPISVSMGVAEAPKNASSSDELVRMADDALYKAKDKGRDRIEIA